MLGHLVHMAQEAHAGDIIDWAAISLGFQMLLWPRRPFCGWGGPSGEGRDTKPTPLQVGVTRRGTLVQGMVDSAASGVKL